MLRIDRLTVSYGTNVVVNDVSFAIKRGQWFMVIGPNGAGKSTIIKAISQGIPYKGTINCGGVDLSAIKDKERALMIGVLSQYYMLDFGFTVEEVVRLGRYAAGDQREDLLEEILDLTGMTKYRNTSVIALSGGELQRAFLSQVLYQDPELLILDEPTNHLDLSYQRLVFELVKRWIEEKGRTVLSVVHDLNLAKAYGTHAALLKEGDLLASGSKEAVMTHDNLERAYGIDVYQWLSALGKQWDIDS